MKKQTDPLTLLELFNYYLTLAMSSDRFSYYVIHMWLFWLYAGGNPRKMPSLPRLRSDPDPDFLGEPDSLLPRGNVFRILTDAE